MIDGCSLDQYAEADRESDGFIHGFAVGVVTDNNDPDGLHRVRVGLPWQPESTTSYWARVSMPMGGPEMGTYFLPEIGDEVLVGFERGDVSHPFVIGSLWNGAQAPPDNNGDGNNDRRLIRSRAGHELRFDDGQANEVELKLSDGKHLYINSDGVKVEDEQGNTVTIETMSGTMTVKSNTQLKLESQSVEIKGTTIDVKATGTLTLKGALVQIN